MEFGPTTIRPSERLEPLVERMRRRGVATIVVSDLKGQLVGITAVQRVVAGLRLLREPAAPRFDA